MKPLAKPEEVLIKPVISTTLRYSIDLKFPSSVVAVIVVVPKPTVFNLFPSIIATFSSLLVIVAFLFQHSQVLLHMRNMNYHLKANWSGHSDKFLLL